MISIQNVPDNLNENLIHYANSFVKDHLKNDFYIPETITAEFLQWNDEPENWAGPWAENFILCIVNDYSKIGNLKTISERLAEIAAYACYSIYNLPYKYRSDMLKIHSFVNGQECSRCTMTHEEYLNLTNKIENSDLQEWNRNILKCETDQKREINAYPLKESPIKIHLTGTDDCSYSLCVATRKEAEEIIEKIKNGKNQWKLIADLGFVFTN